MINEEEYLKERMGRRNPFAVPEGYFDHVADSIMQQLPAEQKRKPAIVRHMRPILFAAACVCLAVFGVTLYTSLDRQTSNTLQLQSAMQQKATDNSDTFIDEVADYAMIDNEDIYASLLADM